MKRQSIFLLLLFITQLSLAQATFEYDQAGNRVKRTVIKSVPDLTPSLAITPNVTSGTTSMRARILVMELLGVPTNGLITVFLSKDPLCPLSFNQSTTMGADGTPVQNPNWTLNSSINPGYYTFTSTIPIAAEGESIIDLTGVLTPSGSTGKLTFTVTIGGGSGGEINDLNNSDVEKISYFP